MILKCDRHYFILNKMTQAGLYFTHSPKENGLCLDWTAKTGEIFCHVGICGRVVQLMHDHMTQTGIFACLVVWYQCTSWEGRQLWMSIKWFLILEGGRGLACRPCNRNMCSTPWIGYICSYHIFFYCKRIHWL